MVSRVDILLLDTTWCPFPATSLSKSANIEEVITRLLHALTHTPYLSAQRLLAVALAEIGGREANAHLVRLLADKKLHSDVRGSIAVALGTLGERSIVPDLVRLLADEKLDSGVRGRIAHVLGELADDGATAYALAKLLNTVGIADAVYTTLQKVSRRAGLRVFMTDAPEGKHIDFAMW